MKKFIFFLCMLFWSYTLYSQSKWEYPVKLGTPEWKSLKSMKEVYDVQQIPVEILSKMTTKEVFIAWIELPGRLEALAYNTMQKGFDITIKRYNVLSELLKRPDVGTLVLDYYLTLNPSDLKNKTTNIEKGSFITDNGFIEFLLSQPEVLKTIPKNKVNSIFKKISKNLDEKLKFEDKDRDPFWVETELILAGRLLQNENYVKLNDRMNKKPQIGRSLKEGNIHSKEVFQDLYDSLLEVSGDE